MKPRIVAIGELLWDLLPQGRKLGGAPANFAYHAGALGAEAGLISRVGNDELGREALECLVGLGLPTVGVSVDRERPTGSVGVELAADGQPRFQIHEGVAWDRIPCDETALHAVAHAEAVCFGTLAQRDPVSRATIRKLLVAAPDSSLRILDVNLRAPFFTPTIIEESLELADVLKLNETELPVLAEMFGLAGDERAQVASLAERFELKLVAYTRGGGGSLLYGGGEWSERPGIPVKVADTIGAGDSFTAAVTLGLLAGWPLGGINAQAAEVAAFVCTQSGATPALPEALRQSFSRS